MIKIVTDSGVSLLPELVGHPDLVVVPLYVVTPQRTYRDGVDLNAAQLMDLLRTAPQLPTTSQPSAGDFMQVYQKIVDAGDQILAITISSKLSGTYLSAEAARQQLPDRPITVVDSLSVSMGQGTMVAEALRCVQQGLSIPEILPRIQYVSENVKIGFVVETLEFLQKGGRIGKASAFLGTLLSVKPVLTVREGEIHPVDKVRTRRRALERLQEYIVQEAGTEQPVHIGVVHLGAEEEARELLARCQGTFNVVTSYVTDLTAILGAHVGPGTIGLGACRVVPS